ncbi:T9SS type A sorting domain-containing protein [Flavobacterium soli]|uniref:T9SS type A sorting domain-containing protein n=1 Tax=Flavobacterium soli TaxID=344881 RepID=UPI000409F4CA|nr:T9SS type A sorting domain-containing protein [Flavobacterium soli]
MKTILKLTLVLAVVLTAVGAQAANGDFYLHVRKEQGKTIRFALNQDTKTEISILDPQERILFSETTSNKNGINRTYDLNELAKGTYFLEVETDAKIARYEITVSDKDANLSKKAIFETFKPVLVSKKGLVTLSIPNTKNTTVAIKVYDRYQNEVYSATLKDMDAVNKKFDVSNFTGEEYTFVMDYDNKSFTESIVSR